VQIDISVFISCYNQGEYIAQAIESVLNQKTDYSFEVIIGDDFSSDNSREIIMDYYKRYPDKIKLMMHPKNIGLVQNFLAFIDMANGEFASFCEGDDYWTNIDKLQDQISFLVKNPSYTIAYGKIDGLFVKENIIKKDIYNLDSVNIKSGDLTLLISRKYFMHTSTIFTRTCLLREFQNLMINKFYRMKTWDYAYMVYACIKGPIKYLDKSYAIQRFNKKSYTGRQQGYKKFRFFVQDTSNPIMYLLRKMNANPTLQLSYKNSYSRQVLLYGIELDDNKLIKRGMSLLKKYEYNKDFPRSIIGIFIDFGFVNKNINFMNMGLEIAIQNKIQIEFYRRIKFWIIKSNFLLNLYHLSKNRITNIKFIRKKLNY